MIKRAIYNANKMTIQIHWIAFITFYYTHPLLLLYDDDDDDV